MSEWAKWPSSPRVYSFIIRPTVRWVRRVEKSPSTIVLSYQKMCKKLDSHTHTESWFVRCLPSFSAPAKSHSDSAISSSSVFITRWPTALRMTGTHLNRGEKDISWPRCPCQLALWFWPGWPGRTQNYFEVILQTTHEFNLLVQSERNGSTRFPQRECFQFAYSLPPNTKTVTRSVRQCSCFCFRPVHYCFFLQCVESKFLSYMWFWVNRSKNVNSMAVFDILKVNRIMQISFLDGDAYQRLVTKLFFSLSL